MTHGLRVIPQPALRIIRRMATSAAAPQGVDHPDVRRAGRDRLSLALMDARNQTLQLLARWEAAAEAGLQVPPSPGLERPEWIAGHVGWFAEYWIGRNPRGGLGIRCPAAPCDHRRAGRRAPSRSRCRNHRQDQPP